MSFAFSLSQEQGPSKNRVGGKEVEGPAELPAPWSGVILPCAFAGHLGSWWPAVFPLFFLSVFVLACFLSFSSLSSYWRVRVCFGLILVLFSAWMGGRTKSCWGARGGVGWGGGGGKRCVVICGAILPSSGDRFCPRELGRPSRWGALPGMGRNWPAGVGGEVS